MTATTALPAVRPYQAGDLPALREICVRTGYRGGDATDHYRDPEVLPAVFAEPYAVLAPGIVFVADTGERVIGYIVGTADSAAFYAALRAEWLPTVAERFPAPAPDAPPRDLDETIRGLLHHPERMLVPEVAARFPAHLHIDLLPEGQRRGLGRRLMNAYLDALRQRGVPGVHLAMDPANTGARAFYDRLGFTELPHPDGDGGVVLLGLALG
ncbi:GNAT family N-acetyltransferase [Streptomyces sp. 6N223]|uniref:GNAT family N-acetyltransferase n=1 Tax=Streptomyces sp. 6N223 TaxID=3457412 RepID=UPI003FD13F4F